MAKITRINPEGISKPFSNYSHVVTAEGAQKLVFCAGQVAADVDGKVLPPDDFEAQAKMVMAKVRITSSPVGWPWTSLMRLNQSRSMSAAEQGSFAPRARAISSSSARMMRRRLSEPVSSSSSASSSMR